jgi:uncharacterized iron-regulated membrane protein
VNTLRVIHRWIGIAIAIPVVLVALSGGLLLFKAPYNRARYPVLSNPITASEVAGYAASLERIDRDFADQVRVVRFPRQGANAFLVYLRDGSEAFVHPVSGETIARSHWQESLPAFLFQLHAHLLAGTPGEVVNGFIALILVFMGLTGLLLWWPRRAAAFRLRRAVPRSFAPSDLLRSHAASGVLILLPVILFAATGAGLVFYEPASRIATALLDAQAPEEPSAVVPIAELPRRPWTEILTAVRRSLPEAGPTMYYPGAGRNAVMTFRKSLPGEWHPNGRSYVLVDPYRAEVVQSIDARAQGAGSRLMHALYPVHAATVGGAGLVLLAILAALGLTYLAIGGSYAYLARTARLRESRARAVPGSYEPRPVGLGTRVTDT